MFKCRRCGQRKKTHPFHSELLDLVVFPLEKLLHIFKNSIRSIQVTGGSLTNWGKNGRKTQHDKGFKTTPGWEYLISACQTHCQSSRRNSTVTSRTHSSAFQTTGARLQNSSRSCYTNLSQTTPWKQVLLQGGYSQT